MSVLRPGLILTVGTTAWTLPVVQTAERILFRVNDDDTVTTIVEIQYQGPPANFAWVLPVGPGLNVEDLGTAPAGLFDELERRTSPVFERPSHGSAALDDVGAGCGRRGGGGVASQRSMARISTSPRGSLRVSPIAAPRRVRATGLVHASRPASGSASSSPTMR